LNSEIPVFNGFSKESINFLEELSENNTLSWFDKNRERYNNFIVLPSKSFIVTIAPFFKQLESKINTEPKFDKTMLRISKDTRYTSPEPYRLYFLIHFRRFKKDSEFFLSIDKKGIGYGLFINNTLGKELFFNKNLPGHRAEFIETYKKFGLNGKFDFYEITKEPELITKEFDIERDFNKMARTKIFLLQKEFSKENGIIYSSDLLIEIIKTFSQLIPVYCFCISHNPIATIEKFEQEFVIPR